MWHAVARGLNVALAGAMRVCNLHLSQNADAPQRIFFVQFVQCLTVSGVCVQSFLIVVPVPAQS
jgi:hypothetical protein